MQGVSRKNCDFVAEGRKKGRKQTPCHTQSVAIIDFAGCYVQNSVENVQKCNSMRVRLSTLHICIDKTIKKR